MSESNRSSSLLVRLAAFVLLAITVASCGGPNLIDRLMAPRWGLFGTVIIVMDIVALVDLLGDEMRSTGNKVLWSLAIVFMPILGVILYFIFGKE